LENKRKTFPALMLGVVLVVFAAGIASLFQLRFQAGDVYPPCSTLRADPLGARAFYESLLRVRGLLVERNYRPLQRRFADAEPATLLCLGVSPSGLRRIPREEAETLDSFVRGGGRLVVTTLPTRDASRFPLFKQKLSAVKDDDEDTTDPLERRLFDRSTTASLQRPRVALTRQWGFTMACQLWPKDAKKAVERVTAARVDGPAGADLPEEISWHSAAGFRDLDAAWRVRYAFDEMPVLIERTLGRGSLVLATDSFFHSNEALRDERHAALLTYLIGPHRRVVFDETHLGVEENTGVMVLARRYGLGAFLGSLLFLAALFVWKNSTSLVPLSGGARAGGAEDQAFTEGIESQQGFVNLLRRNISKSRILRVCFEEWRKSAGVTRQRATPADIERMEAILAAENSRASNQQDPARAYREMAEVLAAKNRLGKKDEGRRMKSEG
jgi:hypothetical protein